MSGLMNVPGEVSPSPRYILMVGAFALPVVWAASFVAALVPLGLYAYSQRHFVSTLAGAPKG